MSARRWESASSQVKDRTAWRIFGPDGQPFVTHQELMRAHAEAERQRAEAERQRAEAERQRAEAERQRADRLAARLRELGVDPE